MTTTNNTTETRPLSRIERAIAEIAAAHPNYMKPDGTLRLRAINVPRDVEIARAALAAQEAK